MNDSSHDFISDDDSESENNVKKEDRFIVIPETDPEDSDSNEFIMSDVADDDNMSSNKGNIRSSFISDNDSDSENHVQKEGKVIVIPETDPADSDSSDSNEFITSNVAADDNMSSDKGNIRSSVVQPLESSTPSMSRSVQKYRRSLVFKSAVEATLDDSGESEFESFVSTYSQQAESPSSYAVEDATLPFDGGKNASVSPSSSHGANIEDESIQEHCDVDESIQEHCDVDEIIQEHTDEDESIQEHCDVDEQNIKTPSPQSSTKKHPCNDSLQDDQYIDLTQSDSSLQNSPARAIVVCFKHLIPYFSFLIMQIF